MHQDQTDIDTLVRIFIQHYYFMCYFYPIYVYGTTISWTNTCRDCIPEIGSIDRKESMVLTTKSPNCISFKTFRPRQNGRHFPDDIFKCTFLNGNVRISIKISLKIVPESPINNIPALVPIMAWRRSGDKPLAEPIMFNERTHICATRPQWVNKMNNILNKINILLISLTVWITYNKFTNLTKCSR